MSIGRIGGAQQYLYNKFKFLESKGIETFIFPSLKFEVKIEGLKKFEKNLTPALMYSPLYFSKTERKRIIENMLDAINYQNGDKIVIETTSIAAAQWGELLASVTKGKNIIFELQESHNLTDSEIDFAKYKLNRHELAGINKESVKMMLKDNSIPVREDMIVSAYCNNVVDDCKDVYSSKLNRGADFSFGSIGRLEKGCVEPIATQILKYCQSNPTKKFNMLLIGGSSIDRFDYIRDLYSKCDNLNLVATGDIYPIPRTLLQNINLFISSAGSANVTYYEGLPTIKVSPTGETLGIMGYSYTPGTMYNTTIKEDLQEEIDGVFNNRYEIVYEENIKTTYYESMNREFDRQLELTRSGIECRYYDIEKMNMSLDTKKRILYFILGHVLGSKKMQSLLSIIRNKKIQ